MMGWDPKFLQSAVDTCTNPSGQVEDCPLFDLQSDDDAATCQIEIPQNIANDNPTSRNGLAVNVPIQSGPAYATLYSVVGANKASSVVPSTSSVPVSASAVVPTLTYSAVTSAVSDKYGGVTLNVAATGSGYASAYASASASASATSSAAASVSATDSESVAATSVITAPASLVSASGSSTPTVVATTWMTSGNEVVEMVIEQVEVTVTATHSSTANAKRHLNEHQRHQHGMRKNMY